MGGSRGCRKLGKTRKDVESYSQMPGKRILALEFFNFSGGEPHTEFRTFGARYRGCAPAVCALHPPFQKSWIRP
jgi:hypothetical protein